VRESIQPVREKIGTLINSDSKRQILNRLEAALGLNVMQAQTVNQLAAVAEKAWAMAAASRIASAIELRLLIEVIENRFGASLAIDGWAPEVAAAIDRVKRDFLGELPAPTAIVDLNAEARSLN
jgi:hypothetical protein